jgi:hypothetical protein
MPTRRISDKICRSEDYKKLTLFQRDLFFRLIVCADDFGRFDGRLPILKSAMYPLESVTEKQIDDGLKGLSTAGIVDLYAVDGKPYLRFINWMHYQQQRAKESKYPAPADVENSVDNIVCMQLISNDCKCSRLFVSEGRDITDCNKCSIGARAYELDRMLKEYAGYVEPDWQKIMRLARKLQRVEMPAVRKSVLLSMDARDPMAYLTTLVDDWITRDVRTLDDIASKKGAYA